MQLVARHGVFHSPACQISRHIRSKQRVLPTSVRCNHQLVPSIELRASPNSRANNVAVLGGGITGLTTAFQLARTIPHAHITLLEKSDHVGGWLNSEVVKVDDGEVLFEWGARTLRVDSNGPGLATLVLVTQLGLNKDIIGLTKSAPASTNRFVYYPDHLVRMPGPSPSGGRLLSMARSLYTILTEPLFKGVLSGLASEPAVRVRGPQVADESVGAFLKRRFGQPIADNLASAVIHGIYAGDLYDLSARTLLPLLWHAETRDSDGNGVIAEFADMFFKNQYMRKYSDVYFQNLTATAKDVPDEKPISRAWINSLARTASVYTFAKGLGVLAQQLYDVLSKNPNVTIHTGASVEGYEFDEGSKQIRLRTTDKILDNDKFDYIVSTLPPDHLRTQLRAFKNDSNSLSTNTLSAEFQKIRDTVDVMVVNLYFANPDLLSHEGFGYLIPRSIPLEQNPERALGVIFGSETSGVRGSAAIAQTDEPTPEMLKDLQNAIQAGVQSLESPDISPDARKQTQAVLDTFREQEERMKLQLQNKGSDSLERETLRLGQDTAPGTKLTVMMGGHWWKGWREEDMPSEAEAIEMAKTVLARHLKISEAPVVAKARLNRSCIPQYRPGYRQSMAAIHKEVMKDFQGRLKLAGPWWQGAVGVNDCVRKARLAAFSIREAWDDKTGLEEYCEQEKYVIIDGRTGRAVMDPLQ